LCLTGSSTNIPPHFFIETLIAAQLAIEISNNVMQVGRRYQAEVPALQLLLQSLDSAALAIRQKESQFTLARTLAPTTPILFPAFVVNNTHNSTGIVSASRSSSSRGKSLRGRRLAVAPSGQPTGQPSGAPTQAPTYMPTLPPVPPAVQLILPSLSIFAQAVTNVLVPGMLLQSMQYDTFGISLSVTPVNQRGKYKP